MQAQGIHTHSISDTFTIRVDTDTKKRLARLAESTGRTRSFLAGEALAEYLDINEWQVAGIRKAIASTKREGTIKHADVEEWVRSWGTASELPPPKPTRS